MFSRTLTSTQKSPECMDLNGAMGSDRQARGVYRHRIEDRSLVQPGQHVLNDGGDGGGGGEDAEMAKNQTFQPVISYSARGSDKYCGLDKVFYLQKPHKRSRGGERRVK